MALDGPLFLVVRYKRIKLNLNSISVLSSVCRLRMVEMV